MKICERGLNFVQIFNDTGDVRICSWTHDGYIGNLLDNSFYEVYHSKEANQLRDRLITGNYCECNVDDCPYLSCNEINEHLLEIDEIPEYPDSLYLAYQNICNYNCSTCNIHERMIAMDKSVLEKNYDIIESKIKPILPHIKHIGASGQGEIFVSKRILKLLSEWEPNAPVEECSAVIETNGSLFDEEHWKQIENLGRYHLTVMVTVMSFNEYTYQQLSGTKLPISKVENNLRYIKSLREREIVNEFHIATVVQEKNFREMPEFARRCVEEFGADYVRLRSFVPWGKKPIEEEWFTDVINPYHPYHEEYVEIMKDPIFNNPKVHDWSGGKGTNLGEHPDKVKLNYALEKLKYYQKYVMKPSEFIESIKDKIKEKKLVIYGVGEVGKLLVEALGDIYDICAIIDNAYSEETYNDICIVSQKNYNLDKDVSVIITPLGDCISIKRHLIKDGFISDKIFTIKELINVD